MKLRQVQLGKLRLAQLAVAPREKKVNLTVGRAGARKSQCLLARRRGLLVFSPFEAQSTRLVVPVARLRVELQRSRDLLFARLVFAEREQQPSKCYVRIGRRLVGSTFEL